MIEDDLGEFVGEYSKYYLHPALLSGNFMYLRRGVVAGVWSEVAEMITEEIRSV